MKQKATPREQQQILKKIQENETEEVAGGYSQKKRFWRSSPFWISCGICLLPLLFGISVYGQLPEQIVTHWGADGTPNGWSPKAVAVFGIPSGMLALNVGLWFMLQNDPKNTHLHKSLLAIGQWTIPVLSLLTNGITFLNALSQPVDPALPISLAVGLLIVITGNYLPKCRPSYTVGIRLPWTLNDEENWVKTHRFGGKLWVAGGFMIIAAGLLQSEFLLLFAVALMLIPPVVYSYILYRRTFK